MNVLATASFTPEDLLRLPDGKLYELVDGSPVEKKMGAESAWIGGELLAILRNFCREHNLGSVFPADMGFQCFPFAPNLVRKPDVSFVRRGRFPGGTLPAGNARLAPDLAVEVVSPNDTYYEVEQKVHEYLRAGVSLVWVVNPPTRMVRIHRPGGSLTDLEGQQDLTGENVLPGFRCRVADLFPQPEGTQSTDGATSGATPPSP
jgi:Uma2 family endonuclease